MKDMIEVTLVNEDEGHSFSDWREDVEDWLRDDNGEPNMGAIYREAQREYGRCTSSVYVDTESGTRRIGWYFVSRQRYEDTGEPYLRGAWVTVGKHAPATFGY